jgi:hypothetical protein
VKNKISETKIENLVPDNLNANKGTEYGQHLIESSLSKFGAARSIVLDRNNKIICGNKTVENAGIIGLEDVIIVETTGKQIVAVKRMDIDLDSATGRELALADNATSKANLSWDHENIAKIKDQWNEIEVADWGIPEDEPEKPPEPEGKQVLDTRLIVQCGTPARLSELFSELQDRGFVCELKE